MALRYYANAPATSLASSCSNSQTSLVVNAVTGFPIQYPYTLIIDRGTATEEAVSVTNASGTTLTVTRAIDSTTAFAHSIGAVVEHGVTAQDIREPNSHINASTAVHGIAGAVVGTTDTQVVTNKDLTSGNTFPTSLATISTVQTLTNKTITLGSNTVSGTRAQFNTAMTDDDFVSLTGTETLTNKTLTSPTVNTPTITTPTITVSGLTALPLIRCTSTTRPAHNESQMIYETDTDLIYVSNGTTWIPLDLASHFKGSYINSAITANTNIAFTSVEDTDAAWGGSTYTVKRAGVYRFQFRFQSNGSGSAAGDFTLLKGGAVVEYMLTNTASAGFGMVQGFAEYRCAANDIMSMRSSVGFTTNAANSSYFTIDWLRP